MILTEEQKKNIKTMCVVTYANDLKERQKKGQFFTPPELIIKMIEKFDDLDRDFIDPCGGNGNLLVGLIAVGVSPESIYFNELDENEYKTGVKRLTELGVPEDHCTNFDALSDEFEEYYKNASMSVIINPPYLRNTHLKILKKMIDIFIKEENKNEENKKV